MCSFRFTEKLSREYGKFPHTPTAAYAQPPPQPTSCHREIFVKISKPTLTYLCHPKSIIYIRLNSW